MLSENSNEVEVSVVIEDLVGLDVTVKLFLEFDWPDSAATTAVWAPAAAAMTPAVADRPQGTFEEMQRACRHQCSNKLHCAHPCCKFGTKTKVEGLFFSV